MALYYFYIGFKLSKEFKTFWLGECSYLTYDYLYCFSVLKLRRCTETAAVSNPRFFEMSTLQGRFPQEGARNTTSTVCAIKKPMASLRLKRRLLKHEARILK